MTKKELKQKTTDELQRLLEFNKNEAIERINEGFYDSSAGKPTILMVG